MVPTENDVRVDCGNETRDGNNRSVLCGLWGGGGCQFFFMHRVVMREEGRTYCVREDPDATVPRRL